MIEGVPGVGDVVDKYEIDGVLGSGGMGAVLRAKHVLTGRSVALKWMLPDVDSDPASVQRFLREARAMGRIDHPNVVGVIDVGVLERAAYLVMEMLRGRSLRAYLERDSQLPAGRAIALLMPALAGVEAAHRAGVVHRDLKPENLFVVEDDEGRAVTTKVLDFGISKLREEGPHPSQPSITQTGTTMGTPSYMSPEQVRGARDVDARTDVWALGAILYEMVTGRVPFRATTYGALMVAIVMEPLVPADVIAPDLDPAIARVIDRALAKEVDERFPSVAALRDALAPFAGELSGAKPVAAATEVGATAPTTPAGARPVPSAPARASGVPTRQGRPRGAARAGDEATPSSGPGAAIELESAAMRSARAGAPGAASEEATSESAPPGARSNRRLLVGLVIACAIPIVAVVVHALTRDGTGEAGGELVPVAAPASESEPAAAASESETEAEAEPAAAASESESEAEASASASESGEPESEAAGSEAAAAAGDSPPRAAPTSPPRPAVQRRAAARDTDSTAEPASRAPAGRTGHISRDEF